MIRSFREMQGKRIRALDDEAGHLKDVYFDDSSWKIRYFLVGLGTWFPGKDVLVSPAAFSSFDGMSVRVELTKEELRRCPRADSVLPVSLQEAYRNRAAFNLFSTAGIQPVGEPMIIPPVDWNTEDTSMFDPHLRSCKRVSAYSLAAGARDIGTVNDFLIDDSGCVLRFLVVSMIDDAGHGKKLLNPQSIDDIVWFLSVVKIGENSIPALRKTSFDPIRHLDTQYDDLVRDIVPDHSGNIRN